MKQQRLAQISAIRRRQQQPKQKRRVSPASCGAAGGWRRVRQRPAAAPAWPQPPQSAAPCEKWLMPGWPLPANSSAGASVEWVGRACGQAARCKVVGIVCICMHAARSVTGWLHRLSTPSKHPAPRHPAPAPSCMLNCLKRRRLSCISRRIRGALSARRAGPRLAHPTAEMLRPCTAKLRAVRSTTNVREASTSVRTAKAPPWRLRSCPNALRQEGETGEGLSVAGQRDSTRQYALRGQAACGMAVE